VAQADDSVNIGIGGRQDQLIDDKSKNMNTNPLLEIPRGMVEMQRLEKGMEHLADTIAANQNEPQAFKVVNLNDVS